jgi:hypothetical protein
MRHSLGTKIDRLFLDLIALTLRANYAGREQKRILVLKISDTVDTIKYFLTILWELKGIENKQYADLGTKIVNIGRMIGGWLKELP